MGIDIGTSKVCVLAVDGESRRPVRVATAPNSGRASGRASTLRGFEQDPQRILETVRLLISEVCESLDCRISGMAFTGQMHGTLLVDSDFRPLTPLITWQDMRAVDMMGEVAAKTAEMHPEARGCAINPGYAAATLYWFCRGNRLPAKASKAFFIHDWVRSCFLREPVMLTDPTSAASAGVFDLRTGDWDWEAIRALEIPEDLFPEVRPSGQVVGYAEEGTPVRCGLGDNQASVAGSCPLGCEEDLAVINFGTGSQISLVERTFEPRGRSYEVRPYLLGRFLYAGASPNGGAVYALLERFFREIVREYRNTDSAEKADPVDSDVFGVMNRLASKAPAGAGGIACRPYFYPERGTEGERAVLAGITEANFTAVNLIRAVLEGMVGVLYDMYREMGKPRSAIVGAGNGIKQNAVLRSIVEDVFQTDCTPSSCDEEAAYGAALLAGGHL